MKMFTDKVALVTGGTSGIGRATAVAFAREGAKVVVAGRRDKEGHETVNLIKQAGGEGLFVRTDISNESDVAHLIEKTVSTYGRLDYAFNNAGVEAKAAPVVDATGTDYQFVFDVNVKGVLLSMKYEIPAMLKHGSGSIVNTSSIAGTIGMPAFSIYVASKHAVLGLTKCAALEVAKQGIRVNAVSPGAIETEMFTRFAGGKDSDMSKYLASLHPVGRIGTSDEVASAVIYLSSPGASFITGHDLVIDGGFKVP